LYYQLLFGYTVHDIMTTPYDPSSMYSAFLSLPTEIRCEIYDYVLAASHAVTVSAGYITVFGQRIQDRARKQDIPGLPLDLAPLARRHYDASLLSVANPPEIAIDNGALGDVEHEAGTLGIPAPLALQLSCHLVNDELKDYMRGRRAVKEARARLANENAEEDVQDVDDNEGLSLYVTYPYGVLVLKSMYPYLLKHARRVYISGYYTDATGVEPASPSSTSDASDEPERLTPASSFEVASSFGSNRSTRSFARRGTVISARTRATVAPSTRPRLRLDPPLPQRSHTHQHQPSTFPAFPPTTHTLAPTALSLLIRTLLPPTPTHLTKLSARIIYAGENSYNSVWSDAASPVSHILRNICGGKIDMKVKRGALGTGMCLTATPNPEGRVISTSWENWRGNAVRRGRASLGVGDLDVFLKGEGEKV